MTDKLSFVHFPHPGGEWDDGTSGRSSEGWTLAPNHRRKFLRARGKLLGRTGPARICNVGFWGEWEPPSAAQKLPPSKEGPAWLHEPYLVEAPRKGSPQNTDPFVFGGPFLYTVCRQYTGERPTALQKLAPGSLILFGSKGGTKTDPTFVLDTVFVVDRGDEWHDARTRPDDRTLNVTPEYWQVTLDRLYGGNCGPSQSPKYSYRLYSGVPYRPAAKAFSFFPAVDLDRRSEGFARPKIVLRGLVNPKSWRTFHRVEQTRDEIQSIWEDVRSQVLKSADLGVQANMPRSAPPAEQRRQ